MSKLANLKKKAADLEQKRQFDRALSVYEEVLQEQEGAEEADIGLFNRVGDLHLRQGNAEAALARYEQAVDLYVDRGFHNNAVALCNKILRQDPTRAEIHFRLGQISCSKGFRTEARRHFQEYVAQLNRGGRLEQAVTALRDFADQNEPLDDVRLMLADILLTHGRVGDAVAQLRRLREQYELQQRHGEAQTVLGRILELDPDFQVGPVLADAAAEGDDAVAPAGNAHAAWSPRTYAAPDLVLFDPSEFSTPARTTPSAPAAPAIADVGGDLLDMDADAPAGRAASMPDGLVHGADFGDADDATASEPASADLAPLEIEPTSIDLAPPAVAALEGLEEPPAVELPLIEDVAAPVELAPAWDSDGAAWEIPDLADDDSPGSALDLTFPAAGDEVVFLTDDDEAAGGALLVDGPFKLPDLPESVPASQAAETETAPPGGWELTPADESDDGIIGYVPDDGLGDAISLPDPVELPEAIDLAAAIELPEAIELADAIEPSASAEQSVWIEQQEVTELPEVVELPEVLGHAAATELADATEPPAGPTQVTDTPQATDARIAAGTAEVEAPSEGAAAAGPPPPSWSAPAADGADEAAFVNLGDWLREDDEPRSTRMVAEERAPSGDEQADFAEMLRKFKQGVADNVDEDDHASHYDLGIAFREMGLVDEAISAFQKALRGTAQRVRAFEALGQCFIDKEQYAVATSVLQRSLQEPGADDERLVGVLYLLGRAAEAQNQRTEALRYYQRVFAVDIEFGDVADRIGSVDRVPL